MAYWLHLFLAILCMVTELSGSIKSVLWNSSLSHLLLSYKCWSLMIFFTWNYFSTFSSRHSSIIGTSCALKSCWLMVGWSHISNIHSTGSKVWVIKVQGMRSWSSFKLTPILSWNVVLVQENALASIMYHALEIYTWNNNGIHNNIGSLWNVIGEQ